MALGCSGLLGPVSEVDDAIGRGTVSIPVPSSALTRGFDGPTHRVRVKDALCAGEIAVWGEVEQAVLQSHEQGETHGDIVRRYAHLVADCEQPAYCRRARSKLAATDGEIKAFWLQVLGTCGDLVDRVQFRDYDADPAAVAWFYTTGDHPPHREGADEGALILATERLVQRGALEPPLPAAVDTLLAHDHPEAAQRLAALVPEANLDVAEVLLKGLAGQSHPDAVAVVDAACERTDAVHLCNPRTVPATPDHSSDWLADLASATDPDRAMALLEAHPDWRDQALAHLADCGPTCAPQASLVDGDDARFQAADAAGVTPREDRAGKAAFDHEMTALLYGRGRLARIAMRPEGPVFHDHIARKLARIAHPELDRVWFHEVPPTADGPGVLAAEVDGRRFEHALDPTHPVDLDAVGELVNHALKVRGSGWRVRRLADEGELAVVVALPEDAELEELSRPE